MKARLLDIAERTARTFVQGFLSVVTLDALSTGVTLHLREKVAAGALAGLYAVLTAFAAPPQVPREDGHADTTALLAVLVAVLLVVLLLGRL